MAPEQRSADRSEVSSAPTCDLSVVIPLHNEEANVESLFERLATVLAALQMSHEVILVDDGSRDGTYRRIQKLLPRFPGFRVIRLRRNFGQTAALAAGFDHAGGMVIVTMDGDLQNPPEEIPRLLARLDEGYDVVSGWRKKRRDSFFMRVIPSRIANWLIGRITGTRLHDYGCSLKAYRREIIQDIKIHGDMHRFLPAFAGALGAQIAELPVEHSPRRKGRSNYGIMRTAIVMVDMISIRFVLPYSFKPLKSFGILGLALLGVGGVITAWLAYLRLFEGIGLRDRPLLIGGVLLVITGVQLIALGILAELQTRAVHDHGRGTYVVRERMGFSEDEERPPRPEPEGGRRGGARLAGVRELE
jgi:glycosyltransferase involved in cell wall biosynthesis